MGAATDTGLWRAPHLPLFLLASVWGALVPLVWLFPGLTDDPVGWHRQELILGFAGAAMGGYLLTALPHWVKQAGGPARTATRGRALQILVAAWIAGRVAALQPDNGLIVLAGIALYPLGLCACLLVPVLSARLWSRLPIALAPVALLLAGLRLRLSGDGLTAVLGMALLVAVVGGRIVPAFLAARAGQDVPPRRAALPLMDRLADLLLAAAVAAHLTGTGESATGALLLAAASGQALRMARWPLRRGVAGQADLAMLVIAWLWLPVGLALTGFGLLLPDVLVNLPLATALHALTMGMMGGMILAVMARASMRRVPGALRAGTGHSAAFVLVMIATVLRLAPAGSPGALIVPAALWCLGWAIFVACAARAVGKPVPHPVLSAARGDRMSVAE